MRKERCISDKDMDWGTKNDVAYWSLVPEGHAIVQQLDSVEKIILSELKINRVTYPDITDDLDVSIATTIWQNSLRLLLDEFGANLPSKLFRKRLTISDGYLPDHHKHDVTLVGLTVKQLANRLKDDLSNSQSIAWLDSFREDFRLEISKEAFLMAARKIGIVKRRDYKQYDEYKADWAGRPHKYFHQLEKGNKFVGNWSGVKVTYPLLRSTARRGTGISRYIAKFFLARGILLVNCINELRVWQDVFNLLGVKHNEARAALNDFVARGGLEEEIWGNKWELYKTPGFDRKDWKNQVDPSSPFPHLNAIEEYTEMNMADANIPIHLAQGGGVASLRTQTIRKAADSIMRMFWEDNVIDHSLTDNLPDDIQLIVWKDACMRLGKRVLYYRRKLADSAANGRWLQLYGIDTKP
jgi:hypothetical protein